MKTYVTQIAKQVMVTAEQSPQIKGSLAQQDGHGYVAGMVAMAGTTHLKAMVLQKTET